MDEEQMMAALQSAAQSTGAAPDTTVGVDPVSGNDVPMGASPEEVRDDIPAQLSAGEYVVPADVVQYYGVKFFEDLRTSAKMGYDSMQQNGRVGGEPAEEMLPFDISELQVMEEPAPAMQMNVGGLTERELHNLTGSTRLPNPFRVVTNDDGLSMTVRADEPVPEGFKRLDAENAADTAPESMSFNTDTPADTLDMAIALGDDTFNAISALGGIAVPGLGTGMTGLAALGYNNIVDAATATLNDPTASQSDRAKAGTALAAVPAFYGGSKSKGFAALPNIVTMEDLRGNQLSSAPGNERDADKSAALGDVGAFPDREVGFFGNLANDLADVFGYERDPSHGSGPAPSSGTAPGPGPSASGADVGSAGDANADAAEGLGGIT